MPHVILQPDQFKRILRRRREMGGDRYDEVWDGVYVMSPLADNEHQWLSGELYFVFRDALSAIEKIRVYPAINVSDQAEDWRKNYRCPDASVFLPGNPAKDRGSHWLGGPDFAVEILSPRDRARKKFDFYGKVGVRELLFVERRPWRLELYRHGDDGWTTVGHSTADEPLQLPSKVLPLSFRLIAGERRPTIEVISDDGERTWLV